MAAILTQSPLRCRQGNSVLITPIGNNNNNSSNSSSYHYGSHSPGASRHLGPGPNPNDMATTTTTTLSATPPRQLHSFTGNVDHTTTHALFRPPQPVHNLTTATTTTTNNNNNGNSISNNDRYRLPSADPRRCGRTPGAWVPTPFTGPPLRFPITHAPAVSAPGVSFANFSMESLPYAEPYATAMPRQDRYYPASSSSRTYETTRQSEDRRKQRKLRDQLKRANKKLVKRAKALTYLLVAMLLFGVVVTLPVIQVYPSFGELLLPWGWGGVAGLGAAPRHGRGQEGDCINVTEHFQADLLRSCGLASTRLCRLNAETAMCILREAKKNLDERTRILDGHLDRQNNILIPVIEDVSKNSISVRGVSAFYSVRPSAYFHLYHSNEIHNKPNTARLLWTWGIPGRNTVRRMGTDFSDETGYAKTIHVTQPGYYYVYSHVTFSNISQHPNHTVVRNFRARKQAQLLGVRHMSSADNRVSHLHGIFSLRKGDTLSVLSDIDFIDTNNKDATYFGALKIA